MDLIYKHLRLEKCLRCCQKCSNSILPSPVRTCFLNSFLTTRCLTCAVKTVTTGSASQTEVKSSACLDNPGPHSTGSSGYTINHQHVYYDSFFRNIFKQIFIQNSDIYVCLFWSIHLNAQLINENHGTAYMCQIATSHVYSSNVTIITIHQHHNSNHSFLPPDYQLYSVSNITSILLGCHRYPFFFTIRLLT